MPDYTYTAQQQNGSTQKGTISAASRGAAIASLRTKHLQPIVIKEVKSKSGVSLSMNISLPGSSGVKSKELVIFTREFAVMINAGVPILRALGILKDQTESPGLKVVLEQIVADIQGGGNLSDAFSKHPRVFSQIYCNMVRAGETGGNLDDILNRLAYQQEKDSLLRTKIRGAMVYPAVIFSVTILAFFILMTFIVPKIATMLSSLSGGTAALPIYTKILLDVSKFMKQPAFLLIVLVGLPIAIVIFRRYIKTPKGRYNWHSFLLRVPAVKVIIIKTAIARFSRIFASLLGAGVNIVEVINTTAGAIGNAVIEKELLECSKAIQSGSQLSVELQKSKHFPPIVSEMLAVGEETGQTDTIILKIAEFYEDEVDTAVDALSSVIEPIMILLLGGMVGLIAVSVFGPITKTETSAGSG
ncbi:MAG TPA: type II secretion system F family protein [Candidatus Saccharimonadales bacterium]|nr:type II secretion system F family protein [Candidatus Saccharimonadales bacterium]